MKHVAFLALSLVAAACARYRPQPLDLAQHAAAYQARRLDDSALVRFVAKYAGPSGESLWTPRQLALAALRFRPEITRARAEWQAARARERTAAGRPPPGAEAEVERAVAGSELESPWVVSLAGLFSLELGGKRGARLQHARALAAVAGADLSLTAWQVVRESRTAARGAWEATRVLAEARDEAAAVERALGLTGARFREATVTSSELARARADVQEAAAAVSASRSALLSAQAALARAVGVPVAAVERIRVLPDSASGCDWLTTVGPDSAATIALTRRSELGRTLARYAVAEADLRLAVARQYPDLELGPGFIWDQGVHRWTLALAAPGLLRARNRGPLAEAEARRRLAAAQVTEAQEMVLGELGTASLGCRGAAVELTTADSQVVALERVADLARAAYQRGETGSMELAQADLALIRARRLRAVVQRRLLAAAAEVEAVVAIWLGAGGDRWPDPRLEPPAREAE